MQERKCRSALKDDNGKLLDDFFGNNTAEIEQLLRRVHSQETKQCNAVLESKGNMWIKIHNTLDNGIETISANPYKTKIIAQAKIKSDKLDTCILSDLLRTGLVYESYIPTREFRNKMSMVRHKIKQYCQGQKQKLTNKIYTILNRRKFETDMTNIFGSQGIVWLKLLPVSPIYRIILDTTLAWIEYIDSQMYVVSKEIT